MASNREAKVKFTAETGEFNDAIKKADSTMKELRSEVKLLDAQMENTGTTVEGLEQKKKILAQQQEQLAAKTQALVGKYETAVQIWGKNSTEAQKLAAKVNDARTAEEKLKSQVSKCNAELQEAKAKMENAERSAHDLAQGLDKAGREAKDFGTSIGDIAAGNIIADFATNAASSLAQLDEATQENRVNMSELQVAYEHSGRSMEEATDVYQHFLGIVGDGDQAAEAALDMRNLADAGANLEQWYDIASGAATAFGDALPVENLIESTNETVRCGRVTGGLADALNWTSINSEQLNTQMAEYPAVMDAWNAATAEGLSNEDAMNAALAACANEEERVAILTAALGQQYSEMGQEFQVANEAVAASRVASDELLQSQSKLADEIAPLKTAVVSLAADGIGFLADNFRIIAPIATAAAVAIGILAIAMNFSAITTAATGAISAMSAALTALSANPVVLVVAGLILIVTTIVTLWNNCEAFRQFWLDLWDGCVASFRKAGEFFSSIGASIRSTVTNISTTVSNVFSNIYNAITSKIGAARDFVGNAIDRIKGFFNFSWSLPQIKLPHFSVSGGQAPWGFGGQGSLPRISVSWYAKAMNKAMVLDSPTIFGYGDGSLLGAGDAGREIVSGESHLIGLIENAVQKATSSVSINQNVTIYAERANADEIASRVFDIAEQARIAYGR